MHTAHVKHGDMLREIANHPQIHYTAVSTVVIRFEVK